MPLTLNLDSSFIILQLAGKSFRLEGPQSEWVIDPDSSPNNNNNNPSPITRSVRWKYHATYEEALNLGSLNNARTVLEEVAALLPPPPAQAQGLLTQWDDVQAKLTQLPVLNNAVNNVVATVTNTAVSITDLGLNLDLRGTPVPGSNPAQMVWQGGGDFTVGLAFTPSAANPIRLFQLNLKAFGAVLKVKLDGLKFQNGQVIWG